jgi:hypothetical protein
MYNCNTVNEFEFFFSIREKGYQQHQVAGILLSIVLLEKLNFPMCLFIRHIAKTFQKQDFFFFLD